MGVLSACRGRVLLFPSFIAMHFPLHKKIVGLGDLFPLNTMYVHIHAFIRKPAKHLCAWNQMSWVVSRGFVGQVWLGPQESWSPPPPPAWSAARGCGWLSPPGLPVLKRAAGAAAPHQPGVLRGRRKSLWFCLNWRLKSHWMSSVFGFLVKDCEALASLLLNMEWKYA